MLRDSNGLFQKMFAAAPWKQRRPGESDCWEVKRDNQWEQQPAHDYFRMAIEGSACGTNWYEGNDGDLGKAEMPPGFSDDAPALLGFDESIDWYCNRAPKNNAFHGYWGHAGNCVNANLNILSLYGDRVPYNICRNLEWQICSAKGLLPGQRTPTIVFSKAPRALDPGPNSDKPFGQCRGWRPNNVGPCSEGYATDDIYFLEVCLFNQICANGHELFSLDVGQPFHCQVSDARFSELRAILLHEELPGAKAEPAPPKYGVEPPPSEEDEDGCSAWCNQYTCHHSKCVRCGEKHYWCKQG